MIEASNDTDITDATSVIIGSELALSERKSLIDGFVNYIEERREKGRGSGIDAEEVAAAARDRPIGTGVLPLRNDLIDCWMRLGALLRTCHRRQRIRSDATGA